MISIIKEITLLTHEEALEALLTRLSPAHPHRRFLEVELFQSAAGKRGENRLQSRFREFHLEEEFYALWDVSLSSGTSRRVQMDGLLLTERCAVVIESKNISGQIHFDETNGEFYRFDDNKMKTVMEDPRVQLNRNMRFLAQWFKLKKIHMPIAGLIVFTSKKCEFMSKPSDLPTCKAYQMIDYLLKIHRTFPIKNSPVQPKLVKIRKLIQSSQTPYRQIPLCQYYHIDPGDVRPGVYCRSCRALAMQRDKRSWICGNCGGRDKDAHRFAVQEYFSLIDEQLTNQKLREFCRIESRFIAARMLAQLNLQTSGDSRARAYYLKK